MKLSPIRGLPFLLVAVVWPASPSSALAQRPNRPPTPGGRIIRPTTDKAEQNVFTARPTPALLKELKARLAVMSPSSTQSKLSRVELAVRIIQVDLALGEKGSGRFDQLAIRPEEARVALEALAIAPLQKLNNLDIPESREVLWNALGSAHPLLRLYSEGARLAGHRDDERVLDRTVRQIKDAWAKGAGPKGTTGSLNVVDDWFLYVLGEALRLQAIESIEDAMAYLSDFPAGGEFPLPPPSQPNDPAARVTRSFFALRAGGALPEFDRLAHLAAALQRAGYDVAFWCLAVFRPVDENTKTLSLEPLLVFPEQPDEPQQMAIGPEWLLDAYEGEYFGNEVYRFESEETLAALLTRRGLYRVELADVLEPAASLAVWSEAMQKSLAKVTGEFSYRQALLEQTTPDPWAEFASRANKSLNQAPRARFAEQMVRNRASVSIGHLNPEGEPVIKPVPNLDERDPKDVLESHEAATGRAFHVLPIKMPPGIRAVTLQSARAKETVEVGMLEQGKLVVKKIERLQGGRGWANRIFMAFPSYSVAVHEMLHAWALARFERYEVDDWKGSVVDLFNEISWEREPGQKWERRGQDKFTVEDFQSEYGATNVNEDFAVAGQYYVVLPKFTRERARLQLQQGNLVPAVKYLFLKYIAFLDIDEQCVEYDLDAVETPFTMQEFEQRVSALERADGLSEEQQRLLELARIIYALSLQMRETKRIV